MLFSFGLKNFACEADPASSPPTLTGQAGNSLQGQIFKAQITFLCSVGINLPEVTEPA